MAYPVFNSFSLQDDAYLTSEVQYRNSPTRPIEIASIAGRSGGKRLGSEFGEKRIRLRGSIIGSTPADLVSKIDSLYQNVIAVEEKVLEIEQGRQYTATVESSIIPDPRYAQTVVPFELEFVCADPFAYGSSVSAIVAVTSGIIALDVTMTISGSFYNSPEITFTSVGTVGTTTVSGFRLDHVQSGHYVSWSGTVSYPNLEYGAELALNYDQQKLTIDGDEYDYGGNFLTRWEPGTNQFTITFGGGTQGGTLEITHRPRYV